MVGKPPAIVAREVPGAEADDLDPVVMYVDPHAPLSGFLFGTLVLAVGVASVVFWVLPGAGAILAVVGFLLIVEFSGNPSRIELHEDSISFLYRRRRRVYDFDDIVAFRIGSQGFLHANLTVDLGRSRRAKAYGVESRQAAALKERFEALRATGASHAEEE